MLHQTGKRNPCDYGSRHPDPVTKNLTREQREEMGIETEEEDREIWVNRVTQEMITAITMEEIVDGTINDPELGPILESKKQAIKTKQQSKGPYGKMWDNIIERDALLIKGNQIEMPNTLQTQAIALAHEGHQQVNGTLRRMMASMWFRKMRSEVQAYVGSCKFQTAIPWNPTPPLKLKSLPKIPWWTTYVNYKGPIGPGKWYVHTQMDGYTRYPEVHITQSETLKEWRNQSVPMGDRTRSGATAAHHTTPTNGPSGSRSEKSKQKRPRHTTHPPTGW